MNDNLLSLKEVIELIGHEKGDNIKNLIDRGIFPKPDYEEKGMLINRSIANKWKTKTILEFFNAK